jgi:hypothetical protein
VGWDVTTFEWTPGETMSVGKWKFEIWASNALELEHDFIVTYTDKSEEDEG